MKPVSPFSATKLRSAVTSVSSLLKEISFGITVLVGILSTISLIKNLLNLPIYGICILVYENYTAIRNGVFIRIVPFHLPDTMKDIIIFYILFGGMLAATVRLSFFIGGNNLPEYRWQGRLRFAFRKWSHIGWGSISYVAAQQISDYNSRIAHLSNSYTYDSPLTRRFQQLADLLYYTTIVLLWPILLHKYVWYFNLIGNY